MSVERSPLLQNAFQLRKKKKQEAVSKAVFPQDDFQGLFKEGLILLILFWSDLHQFSYQKMGMGMCNLIQIELLEAFGNKYLRSHLKSPHLLNRK